MSNKEIDLSPVFYPVVKTINSDGEQSFAMMQQPASAQEVGINSNDQILSSASQSADRKVNSTTNLYHKGAHFIMNISGVSGSPTVKFILEGLSPAGNTYTILEGATIAVPGGLNIYTYRVYPGYAASANLIANDSLPYQFKVTMEYGGTGSFTSALAVNYLK
jgi:hypothetical protein